MILCTTNDARFCPSTVSGSVHVQLFKTKSDSDVLLTLTLTLTMKPGQVFQTFSHFPWFSWRSKGRNCLGVKPIASVCRTIRPVSASGFLTNLSKQMGVSKNRGKYPKMDGENHGKPLFKMDDLGVPLFSETSRLFYSLGLKKKTLLDKSLHDLVVNDWTSLTHIHFDLFNPVREGMSSYY